MGMTLTPVGSIDPLNQPAATRVATSLRQHQASPASATGGAIPHPVAVSAAGASTSSAAKANDITSNDFLTLLVTEMKNQDPTQPTDPNAYIQQLVGVNSLQQLIAINNDLTPSANPSSGATGSVVPGVSPGLSPISAASVALSAPTASLYSQP